MSLDQLLEECIVKVVVPGRAVGSGFFVAPGHLLTCAHVVRSAIKDTVEIVWVKSQSSYEAKILEIADDQKTLDVALLCLKGAWPDHPCVYLDTASGLRQEDIRLMDPLYSYGYLKSYPNGAGVSLEHESFTGDNPPLIKFKNGQIEEGLSGSALLNTRTGKVCGVVKETRGDFFPNGGGAVPISVAHREFLSQINLIEQQESFHSQNTDWMKLLPSRAFEDANLSPIEVANQRPRSQQIDDVLRELNYSTQEYDFKEYDLEATGAFLIRADEDYIQKWLVNRLFMKVTGIQRENLSERERPKTLTMNVTRRMRDLDMFWSSLSKKLEPSGQLSSSEIISLLCESAQTQPFFLVLYGISNLGPVFGQLMEEFWHPLVDQVSQSPRALNGYFVLFLTDKESSSILEHCSTSAVSSIPNQVLALEPLREIGKPDMTKWLRKGQVRDLLRSCSGDNFERYQEQLVQYNGRETESPQETLDYICDYFGFNAGVEGLKQHWKLAG